MSPQPVDLQQSIRFGDDLAVDFRPRRLRCGSRVLKLERIPLELLILFLESPGQILTRDEIVARIWGKDVFLDADNSIRGANRKLRQVLKDDPQQPRYIQTITGQGYRFIARINVAEEVEEPCPSVPEAASVPDVPKAAAEAEREGRVWHKTRLLLGTIMLSALLVAAYIVVQFRSRSANGPKIRSLAVLPLKNLSGDPAQDYLADGMSEELIGRLAAIHSLRVIPAHR